MNTTRVKKTQTKEGERQAIKIRVIKGFVTPLILVSLLFGGWGLAQQNPIRVGSKPNTENLVLGKLILLTLENAGLATEDRTNLGSSQVTRASLENGEIDVYAEYTGTAISNYFRDVEIPEGLSQDAEGSYRFVRDLDKERNDLVWLTPSPANNTFALAVARTFAEEHALADVADLAEYVRAGNEIVLASNDEFAGRPDGLASYERTYDFELRDDQVFVIVGASSAQTEQALAEGTNGVNVAVAYSTDGALVAYDFVVLEDTQGAQPVFQPVAVFRGEVIEANPQIPELFDPLFASLTNEVLQELNAQVDVDGETPEDAARTYLQEGGFLD